MNYTVTVKKLRLKSRRTKKEGLSCAQKCKAQVKEIMGKKKYSDDEVITALMATDSYTKAAQVLGVSRRTLYNYMGADGFLDKLEAAQEARNKQLEKIRETASVEAIECLVSIMKDDTFWSETTPRDRIEAAKTILNFGNPKTKAAKV